ncbi:MAG: TetR/AcrR family transcriptional regulator [Syntrophales bacterium]
MTNNIIDSPQKIKSRKIKKKILEATDKLLYRYGYEYVTVRNICKKANISTGTFYHHFKNKDGLMRHYISVAYEIYKKENTESWDELQSHERVIHLLTWLAKYYMDMGVGFVSSYFTSKNQALNYKNLDSLPKSHKEIIDDILSLLEKAQTVGVLKTEPDPKDIYADLNILFLGTVFDWCTTLGNYNLEERVNKMIKMHLTHYLVDGTSLQG